MKESKRCTCNKEIPEWLEWLDNIDLPKAQRQSDNFCKIILLCGVTLVVSIIGCVIGQIIAYYLLGLMN